MTETLYVYVFALFALTARPTYIKKDNYGYTTRETQGKTRRYEETKRKRRQIYLIERGENDLMRCYAGYLDTKENNRQTDGAKKECLFRNISKNR